MTAIEVLDKLKARGVTLHTDGRVVWSDKGALTPDDVRAIDAVEGEIIGLLKGTTNATLHEPEQDGEVLAARGRRRADR